MTHKSTRWWKRGLIALVIAVFCAGCPFAVVYFTLCTRVMTRESPDGRHCATLYRVDGIDVNFLIYLDWKRVYGSTDFGGYRQDHRERIAWTKDGRWLVFEVAERRLFGFDVNEQRELTAEEIASARFIPFEELGYEGD